MWLWFRPTPIPSGILVSGHNSPMWTLTNNLPLINHRAAFILQLAVDPRTHLWWQEVHCCWSVGMEQSAISQQDISYGQVKWQLKTFLFGSWLATTHHDCRNTPTYLLTLLEYGMFIVYNSWRLCEFTLRAFVTHEWRVLIVPVNDVVIVQYHNVTLTITALNTTTSQILYKLTGLSLNEER